MFAFQGLNEAVPEKNRIIRKEKVNSNQLTLSAVDQNPLCCSTSSGALTDPPISKRLLGEVVSGTAILKIPGLLDRPVIGGGCCAYLVAEAIAHEISALKGVEIAFATDDLDNEFVTVTGDFSPSTLKAVRDAVECFDYEIESLDWEFRDDSN